jgi:hypothetical protein
MSTCSVPDCDSSAFARGWCRTHYARWWLYGRLETLPHLSTEERFWTKVNKNGPVPAACPHLGPCWCWTAGLDAYGYGQFKPTGSRQNLKAHRFAYELLVGPIPEGLTIDHLCRIQRCVNPAHMEPTTMTENLRRRPKHDACKHGHPYAEGNFRLEGRSRRCLVCKRARRNRQLLPATPKPRSGRRP